MVILKSLNYYNVKTVAAIKKYTIEYITQHCILLIFDELLTVRNAPIQQRFKSNITHVEENYMGYTI